MAQFVVTGQYLTFTLNYTTSYDVATDTSTITLGTGTFRYSGASGYSTSASATVTIGGASVTYNTSGTTSGGMKNFDASPSQQSVQVRHSGTSLERMVTIAVSASALRWLVEQNHNYGDWVGPYYYKNTARASGSTTVQTGSMGGLVWISNGAEVVAAQPYISDGESWKVAIPYMSNGAEWEVCS